MSNSFTESLIDDLDNSDGSFRLENRNGKAYLKIFPAGRKGKPVNIGDIKARIKLFDIEGVSDKKLKSLLEKADGKEHEIGIWREQEPQDTTFHLRVTDDNMAAFLRLNPPKHGGTAANANRVRSYLEEQGVVSGFDEKVLTEIEESPSYSHEYLVARGKPPKHAVDGTIKPLFDAGHKPRPKEIEAGKVDLRELGIIVSVERNAVIAEKVAPIKGELGQNVLGEVLPFRDAKEAEWRMGTNVRLHEEGDKLLAEITGRPMIDRWGTIRVDEVVSLEKVDYSTGNVDFPGTIIVQETVADGFRLTTKGSIIIKKTVGKVYLRAEGEIELTEGFAGRGGGIIESGANVYARFVEQGKVISKGSIFIQDASMHSELIAHESIVLNGGRGEFIGGEALAGQSVICNGLGARVETTTRLTVGTPPELVEQIEKLKSGIHQNKETLDKILMSLNKLRSKKDELTAEEKSMALKLEQAEEKYQGLLESDENQYEILINNYQANPESYVLARNIMHPGVEIIMGRGKQFRVTLRPYTGRNYLYLDKNNELMNTNTAPEFLAKGSDN